MSNISAILEGLHQNKVNEGITLKNLGVNKDVYYMEDLSYRDLDIITDTLKKKFTPKVEDDWGSKIVPSDVDYFVEAIGGNCGSVDEFLKLVNKCYKKR